MGCGQIHKTALTSRQLTVFCAHPKLSVLMPQQGFQLLEEKPVPFTGISLCPVGQNCSLAVFQVSLILSTPLARTLSLHPLSWDYPVGIPSTFLIISSRPPLASRLLTAPVHFDFHLPGRLVSGLPAATTCSP